jgi:multisubunit Na+/H+ antiporter MnhB subunit
MPMQLLLIVVALAVANAFIAFQHEHSKQSEGRSEFARAVTWGAGGAVGAGFIILLTAIIWFAGQSLFSEMSRH